MAHRAGLAGEAAAGDGGDDVELAVAVGRDDRLLQDHLQHRTGEVAANSLSLTMILPEPGFTQTRAMAFLRLPVA